MLFKVALLIFGQVLYASAECNIDACAFQKCAKDDEACCSAAVKDLCNLSQLEFGLDPVAGPREYDHKIGARENSAHLNNVLSNVFVRGIRSPNSYSNHSCDSEGFILDIHYDNLDIFASINGLKISGTYEGHVGNFRTRARLSIKYTDGVAKVSVELLTPPQISSYSFKISGKDLKNKEEPVDDTKVINFIAGLLGGIYVENYTKLFNKHHCPA